MAMSTLALDCACGGLPKRKGSADSSAAAGFNAEATRIIEAFTKNVLTFWDEHGFPNFMTEEETWHISLVRPALSFGHHSIMVKSTSCGKHFLLELRKAEWREDPSLTRGRDAESEAAMTNGTKREKFYIFPEARYFDPKDHKYQKLQMIPLGKVKMTGVGLITHAVECLQDLGDYRAFTNNCQTYCQMLAKRLNVTDLMPDLELAVEAVSAMIVPGNVLYESVKMKQVILNLSMRWDLAKRLGHSSQYY